jgi:molecular chaperone GrpE
VTNNGRTAGPEQQGSGPAREQVVISNKRKIDMSGDAKADAEQAKSTPAEGTAESAPTMGQPPKPADTAKQSKAAEPAAESTPAEPVVTGEVEGGKAFGAELEALRSELDERLRDLQRVTAEYANYRKRVERDRGVMAEQTVAMVVGALLPILDDLDRARDHGDLTGQFGTIAEQLNAVLAKLGLTGFGEQGDAFDPTRHEAVAHQTSAEVTEPTCIGIMRRGYLLGDRLLRPALVAVADPE